MTAVTSASAALRIQLATYNFNLQGTANPFPNFQSWLVPTLSETRNEYSLSSLTQGRDAPDIYAVGFQELLPLRLAFADSNSAKEVRTHTAREIRRSVRHHAAITRADGMYPPGAGPEDYTLIGEAHLVGISLFVFGRDRSGVPARVKEVRVTTASTGFFNLLGNKGAVAIRIVLESPTTSTGPVPLSPAVTNEVITLVCAHLTAHDHNVSRRNQDFRTIVRRLAFTPDTAITLPSVGAPPTSKVDQASGVDTEALQEHYSQAAQGKESTATTRTRVTAVHREGSGSKSALDEQTYGLYDCHHTFFLGDLNYRIAIGKKGGGLSKEDVRRKIKQGDHHYLAKHDQLTEQVRKGKAFHGFIEFPLSEAPFGPTYKFKPLRNFKAEEKDGSPGDGNDGAVATKDKVDTSAQGQELSAKKVPGWTDRILWVSNNKGSGSDGRTSIGSKKGKDATASLHGIEVELYRSIMGNTISDHKPVTLLASLPRPERWSTSLAPYPLDHSHAFYRNAGWILDRLVGYTWCTFVAMGAGKILIGISEVVVIALISVWWLQTESTGEGDLGYWFANWAARGSV